MRASPAHSLSSTPRSIGQDSLTASPWDSRRVPRTPSIPKTDSNIDQRVPITPYQPARPSLDYYQEGATQRHLLLGESPQLRIVNVPRQNGQVAISPQIIMGTVTNVSSRQGIESLSHTASSSRRYSLSEADSTENNPISLSTNINSSTSPHFGECIHISNISEETMTHGSEDARPESSRCLEGSCDPIESLGAGQSEVNPGIQLDDKDIPSSYSYDREKKKEIERRILNVQGGRQSDADGQLSDDNSNVTFLFEDDDIFG